METTRYALFDFDSWWFWCFEILRAITAKPGEGNAGLAWPLFGSSAVWSKVWRIWNFDTNMIRPNIRGRKYLNIFEYPNICHTTDQDLGDCWKGSLLNLMPPFVPATLRSKGNWSNISKKCLKTGETAKSLNTENVNNRQNPLYDPKTGPTRGHRTTLNKAGWSLDSESAWKQGKDKKTFVWFKNVTHGANQTTFKMFRYHI